MSSDDPGTVKLASWSPPDGFDEPVLERVGSKPTSAIQGPIDAAALDSSDGESEAYSLEGEAFVEDVSVLQRYRGEILTLRHEGYTGPVYVESIEVSSTGRTAEVTEFRFHEGRMGDVTETKEVFAYRVGLIAVETAETGSGTNSE